jgi:hypothetical protein
MILCSRRICYESSLGVTEQILGRELQRESVLADLLTKTSPQGKRLTAVRGRRTIL